MVQIWLFFFLNCWPKWTKGQLCPHYPSCFGCLGHIQRNDVTAFGYLLWCYWSCVAQCGLLPSPSFLLNCEQRHGVVPAKMVCVRMDVTGHPDSCEHWHRPKISVIFSSSFFPLCYVSGTLEWCIISFFFYFPLIQITSMLCLFSVPTSFFLQVFESF